MILLDTDICVAYLRGVPAIVGQLLSHLDEDLRLPAMSAAELFYGAEKSDRRDDALEKVSALLELLPVVQTDDEALRAFGAAKALLERAGTPLPDADILIAATALSHGCPLATGNLRHFSRIPGIRILDWFGKREEM